MELTLYTWNEKSSLTLADHCLILFRNKTETMIPLSQIVAFEIRDPKSKGRPGMVTVRLAGGGGTGLYGHGLTYSPTNNIDFPHRYEDLELAYDMRDAIDDYLHAQKSSCSPAQALREYHALLQEGIITEEEFQTLKQRLLEL